MHMGQSAAEACAWQFERWTFRCNFPFAINIAKFQTKNNVKWTYRYAIASSISK